MTIDDSFKKPGSVPFKWEIRPGVPKIQHQHQPEPKPKQLSPPSLPSPSPPFNHLRQSPSLTPSVSPRHKQKLKPPPPGPAYFNSPECRTRSFRSTPKTRSERWRFDQPSRVKPECVSPGCFPSPLLKRKDSKKRINHVSEIGSEPDWYSELETLARWSVSSRRSFSPVVVSPTSSFSSYFSSPRPVGDAEWAGFGLF